MGKARDMSEYIKKSELIEWLKLEASPHTNHWKPMFREGVAYVLKEVESGNLDARKKPS